MEDVLDTNQWTDPWIPWLQVKVPSMKANTRVNRFTKMADLIDFALKLWNRTTIERICSTESVEAIMRIDLIAQDGV